MIRLPAPSSHRPGLARWSRRLGVVGMITLAALAPMAPAAQAQSTPESMGIPLIRDTEIEAILKADVTPIWKAAGIDTNDAQVHIVGVKDLQAFVAGGQHLFVFSGLIMKTKNPNELIGVMAHETGHMAGGHLARSDELQKGAMATFLITMGLGILAAVAGKGSEGGGAGAGLMYSAGYFAALQMAGYTRIQEASADQAAATYLEKAGISGKGLVDFFSNLSYDEVFANARQNQFLYDHPLTEDRIAALKKRVETAPHYNVVDTPEAMEQHRIMVAKLKAFMNYPEQTYMDYPETDTSFPARYARAIAHYRALDTEKALKLVGDLIAERPQNPYLYELKGQILFESGRTKEAIEPWRQAVTLAPTAPLLKVLYAQALVAQPGTDTLDEAITVLNTAIGEEKGDDSMAWYLAAQAYDRKKMDGMARLASAEQNFHLGQWPAARSFAMRARGLLAANTPEWRQANDIINISEASFTQARGKRG
jgi:predicted Zn-dependent protease